MRVKKAVLLVLNNKTKGSVLCTNGVHAVLNPVKRRGIILSEGDTVSSFNPFLTDVATSSDVLSTTIFYNRSLLADKVDELDIINVTLSKSFSDNISTQDALVMVKGLGAIDNIFTSDNTQRSIIKRINDIDVHIERITLSLTKNLADNNLVSELLSKIFEKAAQDQTLIGDVLGITVGKGLADNPLSTDLSVLTFSKSQSDILSTIENLILNATKVLTDNVLINEISAKEVSKDSRDQTQIQDSTSLEASLLKEEIIQFFEEATRSLSKSLIDIQNNLETTFFDVSKILSNVNLSEDVPSKEVEKPFTNLFDQTDRSTLSFNKAQNDSQAFSDDKVLSFTKTIRNINALVEQTIFNATKILNDSYSIQDTPQKTASKVFSDFFSMLDSVVVSLVFSRFVDDLVTSQDFTIKSVTKGLEEVVLDVESAALDVTSIRSDFYQIIDELSNQVTKSLGTDDVSSSDSIEKNPTKGLVDNDILFDQSIINAIKVNEEESVKLEQLIKAVSKILSEDPSLSLDELSVVVQKVLSDAAIKEDFIELFTSKSLSDSIQATDNIIVNIVILELLADIFTNLSVATLDTNKIASDVVSSSDIFDRLLTLNRTFNEDDTQDYTVDNTYFLEDYVRNGVSVKHPDLSTRQFTKGLLEVVSYQDIITIFLGAVEQLADSFTLSDTSRIALEKLLFDTAFSTDIVSKSIGLGGNSDEFSTLDTISVNIILVQLLSDSLINLSNTVFDFNKILADTAIASEQAQLSLQKILSDATTPGDIISKSVQLNGILETVTSQDSVVVTIALLQLLGDVASTLSDTIKTFGKSLVEVSILNDELLKSFDTSKEDALSISETKALFLSKPFQDSVQLLDSITVNLSLIQLLSDIVSSFSDSQIDFTKNSQEFSALLENLVKQVSLQKTELSSKEEEASKEVYKTLSDSFELIDLINIVLIEAGIFSDAYSVTTSGRLVSQNYVNGLPGYDSEEYFAEVYVDKSLAYFAEDYVEASYIQSASPEYFADDYVGESRILT